MRVPVWILQADASAEWPAALLRRERSVALPYPEPPRHAAEATAPLAGCWTAAFWISRFRSVLSRIRYAALPTASSFKWPSSYSAIWSNLLDSSDTLLVAQDALRRSVTVAQTRADSLYVRFNKPTILAS